jgi:peptidoglycan/xylan/chitin deacetylase (PgdA/CDA1 family)
MFLRNKRALLSQVLRTTGVLAALEHTARAPCLIVLVYHRISDPSAEPFYDPLISATPEVFRAQMRWLSRSFDVCSLTELEALFDESGVLRIHSPTALVTFDDGYRDNLTHAAPIASEFGIAPTLFVTTGFLAAAQLPWWDLVAWVVKTTRRASIQIDRPDSATITIPNDDRSGAVAATIQLFVRAGWSASEAELARLADRAEVDLARAQTEAEGLFLTVEELRELQARGWSIGAHTVTHRRLAGLNGDEQRTELETSKQTLEASLHQPVRALAYPYGGSDAFDASTRQLAQQAGYNLAFMLQPQVVRPGFSDRLAIPRFSLGRPDSLTLLRARLAVAQRYDQTFF